MDQANRFQIPILRNAIEYAALIAWWLLWAVAIPPATFSPVWFCAIVVAGCWFKTLFFGIENLKQLYAAAHQDLSHHRFLILMGINMTQMIMSFALDFHLLYLQNQQAFTGIAETVGQGEALFDFFYLSTLNFSFFGYSDILPQTVSAKIVNLTEIVLAFVTVIFLLSDFMSLKDSINRAARENQSSSV